MKKSILVLLGIAFTSSANASPADAIACYKAVYADTSVNFSRKESTELCSGGADAAVLISCFQAVYADASVNFSREESITLCRGMKK